MAKINSKAKGARGEREWASVCREQGYEGVRRGQQFSGLEGEDCVGLAGIHQEVKRVEKLNIYSAMSQSISDTNSQIRAKSMPNEKSLLPIVAHRRNNEKWLVTMRAEDWFLLYREWISSLMLADKVREDGGIE